MFSMGRKKGTVRFAYLPGRKQGAKAVALAGDFNGWSPQKMSQRKDGSFVAVVPIPRGEHEYKFVVDGQWVFDRDNPRSGPDPFGSLNSVVIVE